MHSVEAHILRFIADRLEEYSANAYVPFSNEKESALIVLPDGRWIPGVRVESASYSLTISALLNAYTTFCAFAEQTMAFVCLSRPFKPAELTYLAEIIGQAPVLIDDHLCAISPLETETLCPSPVHPSLEVSAPRHPNAGMQPNEGIQIARTIAQRAYVPYSNFPVACILETTENQLIPGVNVEHPDWSQILCAERNALSTAVTYGILHVKNIYLTCTKDQQCSPCGACRQLLAELTPEATLWMDRGLAQEESATPKSLLPAWFTGSTLINNTSDC